MVLRIEVLLDLRRARQVDRKTILRGRVVLPPGRNDGGQLERIEKSLGVGSLVDFSRAGGERNDKPIVNRKNSPFGRPSLWTFIEDELAARAARGRKAALVPDLL